MKKNMMNKMKRVMATIMMACMLLTAVNVSSDAGVMPCEEMFEETRRELE